MPAWVGNTGGATGAAASTKGGWMDVLGGLVGGLFDDKGFELEDIFKLLAAYQGFQDPKLRSAPQELSPEQKAIYARFMSSLDNPALAGNAGLASAGARDMLTRLSGSAWTPPTTFSGQTAYAGSSPVNSELMKALATFTGGTNGGPGGAGPGTTILPNGGQLRPNAGGGAPSREVGPLSPDPGESRMGGYWSESGELVGGGPGSPNDGETIADYLFRNPAGNPAAYLPPGAAMGDDRGSGPPPGMEYGSGADLLDGWNRGLNYIRSHPELIGAGEGALSAALLGAGVPGALIGALIGYIKGRRGGGG